MRALAQAVLLGNARTVRDGCELARCQMPCQVPTDEAVATSMMLSKAVRVVNVSSLSSVPSTSMMFMLDLRPFLASGPMPRANSPRSCSRSILRATGIRATIAGERYIRRRTWQPRWFGRAETPDQHCGGRTRSDPQPGRIGKTRWSICGRLQRAEALKGKCAATTMIRRERLEDATTCAYSYPIGITTNRKSLLRNTINKVP